MGRVIRRALFAVTVLVALSVQPASAAMVPTMEWSAPRPIDATMTLQFNWPGDVDCVGDELCVAVGKNGKGMVSADPTAGEGAWEVVQVDPVLGGELTGISCPTLSFCAAVGGSGHLFLSDEPSGDAAWSAIEIDPGHELADVSCPSASFCAAVDTAGRVLVSSNPSGGAGAWKATATSGAGRFTTVSCPSASFCAAGKFDPAVHRMDVYTSVNPGGSGAVWQEAGLDVRGSADGISCPSASFCAILGEDTYVSTNPTGGAAAWSAVSSGTFNAISCTSAAFCAAGSGLGTVMTATGLAGGGTWTETQTQGTVAVRAVDCVGTELCVALDARGDVHTSVDPAAEDPGWVAAATGSFETRINALSCPSASFCAATGPGGLLYTTAAPLSADAWTATQLDAAEAGEISCASASWCAVLGEDSGGNPVLLYSTSPGAGAGAWHGVSRPPGEELSCPSPAFCAIATAGAVHTSTEPLAGAAAWTARDPQLPPERYGPGFPYDLSCSSAGLCAVAGANGKVSVSADPTGSSATWVQSFVAYPADYYLGTKGPPVVAVQCQAPSFCATLTAGGVVGTSSNPTGGTSAWALRKIEGIGTPVGLSCAEDASLCVAATGRGETVSSFAPATTTQPWGERKVVDTVDEVVAVSCAPSGDLCLLVDGSGFVAGGVPGETFVEDTPEEEGPGENPPTGNPPGGNPPGGNPPPGNPPAGNPPGAKPRGSGAQPRKRSCKARKKKGKAGKRRAGAKLSSVGRRAKSRCQRRA
jgi:hypothetical protein